MTNPDTMPKDLQHLTQYLQYNNFRAECPNSNRRMNPSENACFDVDHFTPAKEITEKVEAVQQGVKQQ